ncbi:MAG: YiiX/YebB-like N1pC/P60 family cysteine hydrolase [Ferruginibacter sp.]
MKKFAKRILYFIVALGIIYLLLLIPDAKEKDIKIATGKAFGWNRDAQWEEMEKLFRNAIHGDKKLQDSGIAIQKEMAEALYRLMQIEDSLPGKDSAWNEMENNFFKLASRVAGRQDQIPWMIEYYNRVRNLVKHQSQHWNMNDPASRDKVYILLYGMRAAVEEVLLQTDSIHFRAAMLVKEEKSFTPAASIFGIEVHSGDLLVSRGGAEVSALISRGNDYPGNFSHIALIYVDEKTKEPFLIEAHIEKGVAIATVAQYENDKKLRFMVMRPRADLLEIMGDSMLPQKAAKCMFDKARKQHIPYDFKMNFNDTTEMFCSEVASYAYLKNGLQVWKYPSTISSQGVVNWLHDFGVENFVTQMPSDLEYDPQLAVVAEWRDPETLFKDHIDNAVMDALLEKANKGETIDYNIWKLPIVRVVKGYCMIKNWFGKIGIIPEGMSATKALKNQTFVAMHVAVKNKTMQLADEFIKQNGYRPPYWQLIKFAETATREK